jgi:hypothetical protein
MNALIITVVLVVIFLLVFVMFSLDDHEEEEGFLSDETVRTSDAEEKATKLNETIETAPTVITPPTEIILKEETVSNVIENSPEAAAVQVQETGSAEEVAPIQ